MSILSRSEAKLLDKFYTCDAAVEVCLNELFDFLPYLGINPGSTEFLEPSAGNGAFIRGLSRRDTAGIRGYDIAPEGPGITRADFLETVPGSFPRPDLVVTGNPPFGNRGSLAVSFLNHGLEHARVAAFILPVQFRKWITQRRIVPEARLVLDRDLDPNSFELCSKPCSVRCCFQIWTLDGAGPEDLRIRTKPPTRHPDFECWQYNATKEAEKYFDYDWDFAVLRQGHGDYTDLRPRGSDLSRRRQWIFFRAANREILERLEAMDFDALSRTNTAIQGFGKSEIISAYVAKYGSGQK